MQSLAEVNHSSLQKQHCDEGKNDQIRFSFQLVVSQIMWQAKLSPHFIEMLTCRQLMLQLKNCLDHGYKA